MKAAQRAQAQRRLLTKGTRRFKRQRQLKQSHPELHDQMVAFVQDSFFAMRPRDWVKFHK